MVDFSYKIINQIKAASDDSHVKIIIENSILNLRTKNNNSFISKRKFMTNMIVALRYVKAEGLAGKASDNVSHAIKIFDELRRREYTNLF